jgi:methionyl-tRNA formyltransferase
MRILFLTGKTWVGVGGRTLYSWLMSQGETIVISTEKISHKDIADVQPDMIISYNYAYILGKDVLDAVPIAINLHISYLPWNKGRHPNVWSWIDDTPKGVTIHLIDKGVDTGDILFQRKVIFREGGTLASSYHTLHHEIQDMFRQNWPVLKSGKFTPMKQEGEGSYHRGKDLPELPKGWRTKTTDLAGGMV